MVDTPFNYSGWIMLLYCKYNYHLINNASGLVLYRSIFSSFCGIESIQACGCINSMTLILFPFTYFAFFFLFFLIQIRWSICCIRWPWCFTWLGNIQRDQFRYRGIRWFEWFGHHGNGIGSWMGNAIQRYFNELNINNWFLSFLVLYS